MVKAIITLFLIPILFFSCSVAPVRAAFSWNIQTVDEDACSSGYGTACPITIDPKNITHIAYTSVGDPWRAVYASWNGSSWDKQTLAEDSFVQCLALDANDNPHILYFNRQSDHFEYASWTGTSWSVQNTGIHGNSFALALDSSGSPHITYTEDGKVKYVTFTGKTWDIQTLDSVTEILMSISIAVDSNNKTYILYSPSSYPDFNLTVGIRAINVKVATYLNSSWNIQAVPLLPPTGYIGNIVVDSKGYPHFICTQHHYVSSEDKTTVSTILYASWNGIAWETQIVVSDIILNSIGQLILDLKDNPHFNYVIPAEDGKTKLMYASWTGEAWDIQTIDSNSPITGPCYLALDANSSPHLSCRLISGMRYLAPLMYATATEAAQTTSPASPTVSESLILTVAAVAVIASVVGVVGIAYVRKKKTSSKLEQG
jgi:hypothetical protein